MIKTYIQFITEKKEQETDESKIIGICKSIYEDNIKNYKKDIVRLACVKHLDSVQSEPSSNSNIHLFKLV